ncbi:MAG TPA: hypothetical protein VHC43_01730 [Mycobacteriales bacterium]|nr:hypothetical protein [Mycobacteriales bacterium]
MPRYAVLGDHTPLACPGASKSAQAFAEEAMGKRMPEIAERLGVKLEGPPLHLDPSHRTLMLAEAPSAEVMRDFIFEAGLNQFNNLDFYMVTPIPEMIAKSAEWPKPFA